MALLTGLTPEGIEVPVQVKPDGKLVAEGLTGPAGGVGPQGVAGPAGPKGDDKWTGDVDITYMHGKVGIGTSSPDARLHVFGGVLEVQNGTDPSGESELTFSNQFRTGRIISRYTDPANITETYIAFHANRTGDPNDSVGETMRIAGSYVGIGTTTPRSLLHAFGVISANDGIDVQSPDGSWWNISVSDAGAVTASRA